MMPHHKKPRRVLPRKKTFPTTRLSALGLERLEERETPATLTFTSGILTYQADTGIDNIINVNASGTSLTVNDSAETIDATSLGGAATGSGTNTVTVDLTLLSGITGFSALLDDGNNKITLLTPANNLTVNAASIGDLSITGAVTTTGGKDITITGQNGIAIGADINSGAGTITILANQDGDGADSLNQTAGKITTTNTTVNALKIIANTGGGGTGNVIIDSIIVGSATGGTINVNSHGGSILYGTGAALSASLQGTANGGSAPARVIQAKDYVFTTSAAGTGSIGTSDRPMQISNFGTDAVLGSNFTLNAGSGGVFVTGWSGTDMTILGASTTGAGTIRITSANAGGHNLHINGNVSAAAGDINLFSDDNLTVNGTSVIGGAGFSGRVYMRANRDRGTAGQPFTMAPGTSIVTSNTTNHTIPLTAIRTIDKQAVYLDISGDAGTPSTITLGSITTGDGGRIVINAVPNAYLTAPEAEAGVISMASASNILDVGPLGTVELIAATTAATSPPATAPNGVGNAGTPVRVNAGTVVAAVNHGNTFITGTADTTFDVSLTANKSTTGQTVPAALSLATTTGKLVVTNASNNVNSGTVTLNGAGGVQLNAAVGGAATGAISITGPLTGTGNLTLGTGNLTLNQATDSTYDGIISGSKNVIKNGSGNLTLTAISTYTGSTTATAGRITVDGTLNATSGVSLDGASVAGIGTINAPVDVTNATAAPAGPAIGKLSTGNVSATASGKLEFHLSAPTTPGVTYDQLAVTGTLSRSNITPRFFVGPSPTLTVGDTFTVITTTGGVTGTFSGPTSIPAVDNPSYVFTTDIVGTNVVATLAAITPPRLVDFSAGILSFSSGSGIDSALTITQSGTTYTITDTSGPISLSTVLLSLSWTGHGTSTVSGSLTGVTGINVNSSDGADSILSVNVGSTPLTVASTADLAATAITSAGSVSLSAGGTLNVSGMNSMASFQISATPTVNMSGTVTSGGTVNLSSLGTVTITGNLSAGSDATFTGITTLTNDGIVSSSSKITGSAVSFATTATGKFAAPTVNLTATNAIGTASKNIQTQAGTLELSAGSGGIFITEADGADVTATATGTGSIFITNTAGTLNIAGATSTASGNLSLSSGDAITLGANLNAGSGQISIAANTDGIGSEGYDQKAATITTTNVSSTAALITVGGTGDAILGKGSIGSNAGGKLTVNAGGSILWSNDASYTAFTASQTGLGNGGSNTQVLRARHYDLNSGTSGSIGTDARPLQFDNYGVNSTADTTPNLIGAAGTGGFFVTVWDVGSNIDLTTGKITALGAGNIRIVAANSTGHNIYIRGDISTGSGNIFIGADDNIDVVNSIIGGAGFSGTVWMQANRDNATNGQTFIFDSLSKIITSSTVSSSVAVTSRNPTTQAVYLDIAGSVGTSQALITLPNITTGDGGRIVIYPSGNSSDGKIAQATGTVLNAGPTGTIEFVTKNYDLLEDSVGTASDPIRVAGGNVVVNALLGNAYVEGQGSTGFAGTTTTDGGLYFTTKTGVLTVNGPTNTDLGPVVLTGKGTGGGVVITGLLNDSNTGTITIDAGTNTAVLHSLLNLNPSQSLSTTATGTNSVSSGGILAGKGVTGDVTMLSGGTISPAHTGVGTITVGDIAGVSGANLRWDIVSKGTAGTDYDQIVAGAVNLAGITPVVWLDGSYTATVGDTFTVLTASGGVTGTFSATTFTAANNGLVEFTATYNPNDIVLTVSNVITVPTLDFIAGKLIYNGGAGAIDNALTVTYDSGNNRYILSEVTENINLTPAAAALFTGGGTPTVTGNIGSGASITSLQIQTNAGNDVVNLASVNHGFTVDLGGSAGDVVNIAGTLVTGGADASISNANTITAASGSLINVGTGKLTLSTLAGMGTAANRVQAKSANLVLSSSGGTSFVDEADGANLTITGTGAASFTVRNLDGTLNVSGVTMGTGDLNLSSVDALTIAADLSLGSGSTTFSANTDGVGAEGYDQLGAVLTSTNTTAGALTINVNTGSGGTGDAIIGRGSIGSATGGRVTVNANNGNILWSNHSSYTAFTASQKGTANGGSNSQVLRAFEYVFNTNGSIGTNDRPIQTANYAATGAAALTAGTGGIYWTDWESTAFYLTKATATSGDIRIVSANAGGHNLIVGGKVHTGSGNIFLAADDDLFLDSAGEVGGPTFAGTITVIANRDGGNGQAVIMHPSSKIETTNNTASAVLIQSFGASGSAGSDTVNLGAGGVFLANVTVGNGGTITVTAGAALTSTSVGAIIQHPGTLLDAGVSGTVTLTARAGDSTTANATGSYSQGNIGVGGGPTPVLLPIIAKAGTINTNVTGSALVYTGSINVRNTIDGKLNGTSVGNPNAVMTLGTSSGVMTIPSSTTTSTPGDIVFVDGTLAVEGTLTGKSLAINTTHTVVGSGTINAPVTFSGNIAPGTGVGPGITGTITTGNLAAGTSGTRNYFVDLMGTAPGQFDQIKVNGTVNLTGATLTLSSAHPSLSFGDTFRIIDNDGTDAVVGTFAGLPEAAPVTIGSDVFAISYVGGTGNDVVLTKVNPAAVPGLVNVKVNGTTTPSPSVTFSRLTSITLTFDIAVNIAPGALTLTNGIDTISVGSGIVVSGNGTSVITLSFTGTMGVQFGSLADGIWTLTSVPSGITNAYGTTPMSSPISQGDIRRLFGDTNGDGTVDITDFVDFSNTWQLSETDPGFNAQLDFNNDGTIDITDFVELANRWGVSL